jgi:hypothetical protein
MSRTCKTRPLTIPIPFKDSAKDLHVKADPFRALISDRLRLKPSCPSRRHASTTKTRPKQENCPSLPILRPALRSAGQQLVQAPLVRVKKLFTNARFSAPQGSSTRALTRFSGAQDSSSRALTRFSDVQDSSSRVTTPYFGSRQSNAGSELSSASTAQSSSANSPGKDLKSFVYLARCLHYPEM